MTHADHAVSAWGRSRDGNGAQASTVAAVPGNHSNCPGAGTVRTTSDNEVRYCPRHQHTWTVPLPRNERADPLESLDLTGLL